MTRIGFAVGTVLADGRTIAAVEDYGSDTTARVVLDDGSARYVHWHSTVTPGGHVVQPEYAGWAGD